MNSVPVIPAQAGIQYVYLLIHIVIQIPQLGMHVGCTLAIARYYLTLEFIATPTPLDSACAGMTAIMRLYMTVYQMY